MSDNPKTDTEESVGSPITMRAFFRIQNKKHELEKDGIRLYYEEKDGEIGVYLIKGDQRVGFETKEVKMIPDLIATAKREIQR